MKTTRMAILLLLAGLCVAPTSWGQGIGGAIEGVIRDQSGGVVPAALIRIANMDTAQARTVSSDGEGRYRARELPPGLYEVKVELAGFNTVTITGFRLSVGQIARQDMTLEVAPIGSEKVVVKESEVALVETTTPTLSTSFSEKQIRDLPILTRDLNNLALFAPGVFSVRTFSFASTLVPFAANGSRGRDNNFIIDSVDNNEPLFGGAATQFTNTDLFAEYRILTNQYKAEYGRNSGSVVNIITERGGNNWKGSLFWFGQTSELNATNNVERTAGLGEPAVFYENQAGATLGGPIKKESTWVFASYQWDRARHDLTPIYPLVATLPTATGLSRIATLGGGPTLAAFTGVPSVTTLPLQTNPCSGASNLPATNPCTIGSVNANTVPIPFGTFLVPRAGLFDVRDHQLSLRIDQRLTERDDFYARYLFDDLVTPRTVGALPAEVAFTDLGLLPEWRVLFKQRTQNLGLFWTHAWPTALHELRGSFTRISSQTGSFGVSEAVRERQPAVTIVDLFARRPAFTPFTGAQATAARGFLAAFPAAGEVLTVGRDTRPRRVNSNVYQLQDNVSISKGRHSIKFGGNFVRTQSNIREMPSDLGQYVYGSFEDFVNNLPAFAFQRFGNFEGQGLDDLPLREFGQFYFLQDDIRLSASFTVSLGLRYENYGQAINTIARLNPRFGGELKRDNNNFAPRIGWAWALGSKTTLRGGYGVFYNPTAFNIALIAWQSGPVSPFVVGFPTNVFPSSPFNAGDVFQTDINFTTQDSIDPNLVQPYVQNFSLSLQRQMGRDFMVEATYVGSVASKLYQRLDINPNQGWITTFGPNCGSPPCLRLRRDPSRGAITRVTNSARSNYHAVQISGTKRLNRPRGLAITGAYTWSHMIDNASEIFGPGVRALNVFAGTGAQAVEAITPFPQNPNDAIRGERANSSFDRRHRFALSYLWALGSPSGGAARFLFGNWQFSGFFTAQSGQAFSPLNASLGACADANGDGGTSNDRPDTGSASAPANSVALLNNRFCLDPTNPVAINNPIFRTTPGGPSVGPYVTPTGAAISPTAARFVQAPRSSTGRVGTAGRNSLLAPNVINWDVAIFKNFPWGERKNLQFRVEAYNLLNRANPGNPIGNIFTTDAQPVPAIAFAPVGPTITPARVIGTIPENIIDALDPVTGQPLFLSQRFMNTSSRRIQFAIKFLF